MGIVRFWVPSGKISKLLLQQAFVSGLDPIPQRAAIRLVDSQLVVQQENEEGLVFNIPWYVEGHGWLLQSTATLIPQETPYQLPLELARGKLARLGNHLAEWQLLGLNVPQQVDDLFRTAVRTFARAAVLRHDCTESVQLAERALRFACDASLLLAGVYCDQLLAARRRTTPRLQTLWGARVDRTVTASAELGRLFAEAFNCALIPIVWAEVEPQEGSLRWDVIDQWVNWAQQHSLRIALGPLFVFDKLWLPHWLALFENDVEALRPCVLRFVRSALERYRGRVHLWIAASRFNTGNIMGLNEEDRVRLVAEIVETVRADDSQRPVIIGIDQPWAEFSRLALHQLPPFQLVDVLLRSEIGVSGLLLELNLGYYPTGSPFRDPLEFGRLMDGWALLGTPLFVSLTAPSSDEPDSLAVASCQLLPQMASPTTQAIWASRYLPMLVAKPYVYGVFWGQFSDQMPHEFPHGGLVDARNKPKPTLLRITALRKQWLV